MANNTTQMQSGVTFLKLITENKVLIPVIQRDYAQGRLDSKAREVREGFVSAIIDKLVFDDTNKPLLLDFIYGSTNKNLVFTPLDGQQRLTTLFLLHWYLIPKDKLILLSKSESHISSSLFSYETRISSKDFCDVLVRVSLNEIKQQLISRLEYYQNRIIDIQKRIEEAKQNKINSDKLESELSEFIYKKNKACLSEIIKDQSWFMWSWRNDPTVKGMLVMLDELDHRLKDFDENGLEVIWEKLKKGAIVFHLLPLEQFSLTDELYVKMNARGKELSPFDFFKSTLEEQMRRKNVPDEIQNKWRENIDSIWIDLFWNKLAKPFINENYNSEDQKKHVDSVEQGYLTFFKRIISLYFVENIDSYQYRIDLKNSEITRLLPFPEYNITNIKKKLLEQAIQKDVIALFPLFIKTDFFNENLFQYILNVFNDLIYLDSNNVKHDGSELIDKVKFDKGINILFVEFISPNIDYENYLMFYALTQFLKYNPALKVFNDPDIKLELNAWMRIVRNLSTLSNTFIDSIEDFSTTLNVYKEWCLKVYDKDGIKSITKNFENHPKTQTPKGRFVNDQFEEEITKAILIEDRDTGIEWSKEILEIEERKYFLGQIRFILEWSKDEKGYNIELFKVYKEKLTLVFNDDGLTIELCNNDDHLFRNCLISNSENYFLLKDDCLVNNTGKDRDRSWKSYLRSSKKSQNIKLVLDKFLIESGSFVDFCKSEINKGKSTIHDWRRCFLNKPDIYNKCSKNQVDYWDKSKREVCLLETSTKWKGHNKHSELNTYYWHLKFHNFNGWESKYLNSQHETPLVAIFSKEELKIETIFKNNGKSREYNIKLNYEPNDSDFVKVNDSWCKTLDTNEYIDVENKLEKLLICPTNTPKTIS